MTESDDMFKYVQQPDLPEASILNTCEKLAARLVAAPSLQDKVGGLAVQALIGLVKKWLQKLGSLAAAQHKLEEVEAKLAEVTETLFEAQELKNNAVEADKQIAQFTAAAMGKDAYDWLIFGFPVTELSRDSLQRLVIYAYQNHVGFNHFYDLSNNGKFVVPDVEPYKSNVMLGIPSPDKDSKGST